MGSGRRQRSAVLNGLLRARRTAAATLAVVACVGVAGLSAPSASAAARFAGPSARRAVGVWGTTSAKAAAHPLVQVGVATPDLSSLDAFERATGKQVSIYTYYKSWASAPNFDSGFANQVMSRGATPEITWEPWDPRLGATQPAYQLQRIVNGAYDTYLTRWADEIKQWGNPLIIRLAHEMNTANYPWSASANGNSSAAYVAFWRHVRAVFAARGVTNVTWVWCPNVGNPATYAALYPGDAYVDQVGLDGYNGGTALPWGGWLSFSQLFGRDLTALESLSSKPVVIGETSSVERGGSKSTWIRSMFTAIAADSRIVAVTWFDFDKEADWRVQSSTAAVTAFHAGSTGARFS